MIEHKRILSRKLEKPHRIYNVVRYCCLFRHIMLLHNNSERTQIVLFGTLLVLSPFSKQEIYYNTFAHTFLSFYPFPFLVQFSYASLVKYFECVDVAYILY